MEPQTTGAAWAWTARGDLSHVRGEVPLVDNNNKNGMGRTGKNLEHNTEGGRSAQGYSQSVHPVPHACCTPARITRCKQGAIGFFTRKTKHLPEMEGGAVSMVPLSRYRTRLSSHSLCISVVCKYAAPTRCQSQHSCSQQHPVTQRHIPRTTPRRLRHGLAT
jgi:hypothetical protein